MNKKIVAMYKDAWSNVADHRRWPYSEPLIIWAGSIVLFEEEARPWWNPFKRVHRRAYQVYPNGDHNLSFDETDIFADLVKPWMDGVDLKYLESQLKISRAQLDPHPPFIYKEYDQSPESSPGN